MLKKVLGSLVAFALVPCAAPARVLINGYDHEGEWRNATLVYNGSEGRIEALKDKHFLYLRISRVGQPMTGADLYIGSGERRIAMLHTSTALSENDKIEGQSGYDYGVWGRNKDWAANVSHGYNVDGKLAYVHGDITEYQVALGKFPKVGAKLMVVLKRPTVAIPTGSDPLKTDGWLSVDMRSISRIP